MAHLSYWLILPLAVGLLGASGCQRSEAVTRYTVDKTPELEPLAVAERPAGRSSGPADNEPAGEPKDRTLAAIVPVGDQGWFFKLTGPKDAVAAQSEAFQSFLKSVHFSAQGKPQWTLPADWQERGGSDIRYATLVLPGEGKPLEVSVTALPKSGDDAAYALVNVNRWRGQLQLPPIGADELAGQSIQVPLAGATATVVDLLGTSTSGGMGRPPFFSPTGDGK